MTGTSRDAAHAAKGRLYATAALLWEAVKLLSPEQLTELTNLQHRVARSVRDHSEQEGAEEGSAFTTAFVEEVERLALLLKWQRPGQSPSDLNVTADSAFAVACMKCGTFPLWDSLSDPEGILDPELQCPTCKTQRWCVVVTL